MLCPVHGVQAKAALDGWEPEVALEAGLKKTIAYFKALDLRYYKKPTQYGNFHIFGGHFLRAALFHPTCAVTPTPLPMLTGGMLICVLAIRCCTLFTS